MATLIDRIPDDKHLRLKELPEAQAKLSRNFLLLLLWSLILSRFKLMAARGDVAENLG